jgi:hypothetical protein
MLPRASDSHDEAAYHSGNIVASYFVLLRSLTGK